MEALIIISIGLAGTCVMLAGVIAKQRKDNRELAKLVRDHQKEIKNFQAIIFADTKTTHDDTQS